MRFAVVLAVLPACAPITPDPADPVKPGFTSETKVTVTRVDVDMNDGADKSTKLAPNGSLAAQAIEPKAAPAVSSAVPLLGVAKTVGPLPIATTIATTRGAVYVFGRTRGGYVVRTLSSKTKTASWSPPIQAAPSYDDDDAPFAIGDGDAAWFGVTSPTGGTRIVRVGEGNKITSIGKIPLKLGRIASFVTLKSFVVVVGHDGEAITSARLDRTTGFLDGSAKVIAQGLASPSATRARAPRATNEDDKILLAWDAEEVPSALEAPGTTPAERAHPKPGIYVRRFTGSGEPASPARRLTRPSFEAHAVDVVVELGACAVLASTPDGFEMFRFVRKGNDLGPYGGGLHLAPPGGDVALGADVIGTIGVSSSKLLRIGPGIKIVASPLSVAPPPGGAFDEVRLSPDGYGAHVLFGTRSALGTLPTIARIDGDHVGAALPTPWIGPTPQRLVFAAADGDEALALVVEGGSLRAVRVALDGKPRDVTLVPFDVKDVAALEWPKAPAPRAGRANGEWVLTLQDRRVLIVTGPRAGTLISIAPPKGAAANGYLALVPSGAPSPSARVVWIPPRERAGKLWSTTIDPKLGTVDGWTSLAEPEHYYGALGGARFTALPRITGGLYLLTNAGPKVSASAQSYLLVALDHSGAALEAPLDAPAPMQDIAMVPTTAGPAIVATLTGRGVATRWLDGTVSGWRESFAYQPFRLRGDGPVLREQSSFWVVPQGALPVDLGAVAAYVGERCPYAIATGPRTLLVACEEAAADSPLAARVTTRLVSF